MKKTIENVEKKFKDYGIKYASQFTLNKEEDIHFYNELLNKQIRVYEIEDECSFDKDTKNIGGLIKTNPKKEGFDNTFWIWAKKSLDLRTLAINIIHEIDHAIAELNSLIIKDPVTKKKYKQAGFKKTYIYSGEVKGYGLHDLALDLVSHMQFFHYYKKHFPKTLKNKTADTVFNERYKNWLINKNNASYEQAVAIPKLLARACENSPYVNYEKLLNNNISPVTGKVKGRNNKTEYINDMLHATLFTSFRLKWEMNELSNDNHTYDRLIELTDTLYDMNKYGLFNPNNPSRELKNILKETFDIIKDYHDQKAMKHLETGFWNEKDYEASNKRFNSMYQEVLHEFKIEDKNNNKNKRMVK